METSVTVQAMSAARLAEYLDHLVPLYAQEGARATGTSARKAGAIAQRQIGALLPRGAGTQDQYPCDLLDEMGRRVGVLWYASHVDWDPPSVFLYDIRIDVPHRRRGLGAAAMRFLEHRARALGATEIALHVFSHNRPAIRMYEQLGYLALEERDGGIQMAKALGA